MGGMMRRTPTQQVGKNSIGKGNEGIKNVAKGQAGVALI
jgi:hypothetical protein